MGYAIATGHHLTSETAAETLKSGGNAIDAALAAFVTAFTTEPAMASPGGGALALISYEGKCYACDFFCHTPRKKK